MEKNGKINLENNFKKSNFVKEDTPKKWVQIIQIQQLKIKAK